MKPGFFEFPKLPVCLCCLCLALLTGCGQKGPLMLPDQAAPPQPAEVKDTEEESGTSLAVPTAPIPDQAEADDDDSP